MNISETNKSNSMTKKVLVCDDDMSILGVIKIILESNGFEVEVLSSGKGIQKKVLRYNPDLILLDIWMPGLDGKEATKLLKTNPQTHHIPIILLSALDNTKDISKKAGADGYLAKPFEMNNLLSLVSKYTKN